MIRALVENTTLVGSLSLDSVLHHNLLLTLPQIMRGSSGLSRFATEREAEDPVLVVIYFLYLFLQTSVNFIFSKMIYLT